MFMGEDVPQRLHHDNAVYQSRCRDVGVSEKNGGDQEKRYSEETVKPMNGV